jgi:hypothetical protein
MANTIQLRRSATANAVPTTTQLALGELAINTTDGKIYLKKNVSGTESIVEIGAGGASISVSDTAPVSPINGSLWWDTTVGQLKIYYTDGTSNQWVDAVNSSIFVPKATATSLGSVEIFDNTVQTVAANAVTATASRTYGVQLNSDDQMVVNVPWSGGGGSSPTVGEVVQSAVAPSSGTWLQTGKYYSKASYPTLAAALGDVPDIGSPVAAAKAQLPVSCSFSTASGRAQYLMATSGSAWVFGTSSSAKFIHTLDGAAFSAVPPNSTINSITGVWYVNSLFVATTTPTSTGTTILVSSDGLNWSSRTMRLAGTTTTAATSVAYGAGRYVISYDGGIFYSSDLITFTQATSAGTGQFNKVIYAGGQFVAVAFGGTIVTSSDGITWTSQSSPSSQFFDIIYANGIYVAYGNFGGSTNLITSTDGVSWNTRSVGFGNAWQVLWSGTLFVAATTAGVYTSPTGTTWTLQTTNLVAANIRSVGYVGSTYYAGTNTNGYYATSSDGSTWTLKRDAGGLGFFAFFNVNGKTVATGDGGITILSGGTREAYQPNFSFVTTSTGIDGKSVAYNGSNQFVMVSSTGLPFTSTDGENWTAQALPSSATMVGSASVSYLNGNYLIHGNNGTTSIFTSSDGVAWTAQTTPSSAGLNSMAFGASTYVAVGAGGNVFSSTDLATWTSRSAGANLFNDVIFDNSLFVAVGASGAIYTSPDGSTWTSRSAGANQFFRVLWAAGSINLFVAIGAGGAVYTSPDGATWTSRSAGSTQFNDMAYDSVSGTIVIIGNSGVIYSSTNGTTWTQRVIDTTYSLGVVVWDGTRFFTCQISATANNAAYRSTDGITWTRTYVPNSIGRLQWIGGKYIRTPSAGNQIYTSTDSFTWVQSVQNTFRVTGNLSQLQKVGNVYFTSAGFTSTDGITFNRSRSFINASVAYDGTYYYCSSKSTGSSLVVYRSSNGSDWTFLTELGTDATITRQATFWQDMLYASGKLVAFTAGYAFSSSTDIGPVYYSTDGITWTNGQFPAGGFPGTLASTGLGVVATDGTTLVAAATTASTSYGMYKSTNGGATWTPFFGSTFAPIIYTGGYWYWQSFKTADASTVTGAPTSTFNAFGSHNGYGFNIFGNGSQIWEATLNNNNGVPSYSAISTPGAYGLVSGTKPAPVRTSDNRVLTMANIGSLAGTMTNPISEYPLFSYDTSTTFFVPQQVTGLASNEYIYAGA